MPIPYFFEEQAPDQTSSTQPDAEDHKHAQFLTSPEGFRLNSAFLRIKDEKVRRAVVDLIRALGDEQEDDEKHTSSLDGTPANGQSS